MRLLAVDDDIGTNALLKFAITGGNEGSFFTIDSGTGNFDFQLTSLICSLLSIKSFLFMEARFLRWAKQLEDKNSGILFSYLK